MNPTVFPVRPKKGEATYVDTYGAPRSGGRSHKGTDIYAERGSDILAVEDGYAQAITGQLTGIGVALSTRDGARYVYAHLDDYVGPLPRTVKAGDVIGRLGDSGNAKGGRPHLHFEILPSEGTERINPAPVLARLRLPVASRPLVKTSAPIEKVAKKVARAASSGNGSALAVPLLLLALASANKRKKR